MVNKLAKTRAKFFWSLCACLMPREVSRTRDTGALEMLTLI